MHNRYLAEQMVKHAEREDCYIARLVVRNVSPADSRRYFLNVENAHGTDRYAVSLNVKGMYVFIDGVSFGRGIECLQICCLNA